MREVVGRLGAVIRTHSGFWQQRFYPHPLKSRAPLRGLEGTG
jgi:hypothetical protein